MLADFAPPPVEIHALYPSARFLASKVRLFLDFVRDELAEFGGIVVAHPRLEQIAEDKQRIGPACLAVDEVAEQAGHLGAFGVEVEVGNE